MANIRRVLQSRPWSRALESNGFLQSQNFGSPRIQYASLCAAPKVHQAFKMRLCCFRNTWWPMSHRASLGVLLRSASVRACLFLLQPAVAVTRAQLLRPAVRPRLLEQVVQSLLCARMLYLHVRVQASVQACQRASTLAGKPASVQACGRAGEPASQHFRKKASHRTQPASQPASKQASKPAGQRTVTQASHPASALPISSAQQGHEQAGQQASRKASERAGRKASQQANQQASQQANQQASQPARDGASSHV